MLFRSEGVSVPPETPAPAGGVELAKVKKGDLLRIPLTRNGDLADRAEEIFCQVWAQVTALKTSGTLEARPCEFNVGELKMDPNGVVTIPDSRIFGLKLKGVYTFQNASLLSVYRNTPSPIA